MLIAGIVLWGSRILYGCGWTARTWGVNLSVTLMKELRTIRTAILLWKVFHKRTTLSLLQLPLILLFSARTLFLSFPERGPSKNLQFRMGGRHRNRKFQAPGPRAEAGISTSRNGSPEAGHLAQAGKPFREIYFKLIVLFAGFYIDMFCFVLTVFWDCSLFIYY